MPGLNYLTVGQEARMGSMTVRKIDDEVMREMLEEMDVEQAAMATWLPEGEAGS